MRRLVPFPLASSGLFALWLLLQQSLAFGHVLLAAAIALAGGWSLTRLEAAGGHLRRLAAILRLMAVVLSDIIRSNIAVARIILGADAGRERTSGFVQIPLDLRAPYGLAALAGIITATPGTLWVSFDAGKGVLLIHVLDLIDESDWIETIKGRYERLLREIFE